VPVSKEIKALVGFSRKSDDQVLRQGYAVYGGMYGSRYFSKPPVDLELFKVKLDAFAAARSRALDRSRTAFAEKAHCREEVVRMLVLLGHYAAIASNGDYATFVSSGFKCHPQRQAKPQPTPQPKIVKVKQGVSGELLVFIMPFYRKVISYELRYSAVPAALPVAAWPSLMLTSARAPASIRGLTPGVVYSFQVRAFGKLGHSDWSDAVTRRCI
jgi:hypothetical protein